MKTFYERHGHDITHSEILQALSALLTATPYHPIWWSLYYMCKYLYSYKREITEEIVVENYYKPEKAWLSGNMSDIRDLIAIDDTKENNLYTYATIRKREKGLVYLVPSDWLKRLIVRNKNFVLVPFEFCC